MQNSFSPPVKIPTLSTERLVLRPHRLNDFAHCAAMWGDPNVTRHILGKPLSEEESWSRFLRYAGHWDLLGFGYWVVEEKHSGDFVGEIGFADYRREIVPPLKGMPEIGWVLASRAHGKGYATEAVRAANVWGDVHFEATRTVCIVALENVASVRVAAKCGYQELQTATYHGERVLLFVRQRAR